MALRNLLGSVDAGTTHGGDNVAIALATYFDMHLHKPEGADDEIDDEVGWSNWVVEQVNATLDALVAVAVEELAERKT
jgi:hypothetical protein